MKGLTLNDISIMDQARKAYLGPSRESPTPEQVEAGRKRRLIEEIRERRRQMAAMRDPWEC